MSKQMVTSPSRSMIPVSLPLTQYLLFKAAGSQDLSALGTTVFTKKPPTDVSVAPFTTMLHWRRLFPPPKELELDEELQDQLEEEEDEDETTDEEELDELLHDQLDEDEDPCGTLLLSRRDVESVDSPVVFATFLPQAASTINATPRIEM
jgi:hypothetical protein